MDSKELFESMQGYEYFKAQLTRIPEENRDFYLSLYLGIVGTALLC